MLLIYFFILFSFMLLEPDNDKFSSAHKVVVYGEAQNAMHKYDHR
jgi:hypothetical protein